MKTQCSESIAFSKTHFYIFFEVFQESCYCFKGPDCDPCMCRKMEQKTDPSTACCERQYLSPEVAWAAVYPASESEGGTRAMPPSPLACSHHSWLAE